MWLSKTELEVISEIGKGNGKVPEIAAALKISLSQVYRIAQKLSQKQILRLKNGVLEPEMKTHISMLFNILSYAANLSGPLSGAGLQIHLSLLEPKTTKEIEKETNLHKTTILKKINQGRKISLLLTEKKKYRVNEKIWQNVREFLLELKKYEESVDSRIPVNSIIYFKTDKEIVFSNKEGIDAEKTAFSAYGNFGIKLLLITNYYYLPKKKLAKKEVFMHSLCVAEKSKEIRHLIFTALFLAKFKELSKIKHSIVKKLNEVLSGKIVSGYPTLAEIKDRASIYRIKV